MKRIYITTIIACLFATAVAFWMHRLTANKQEEVVVTKVGFVYVDDESAAYTSNFARSEDALVSAYGDDIQIIQKYNIPGDGCRVGIQELVDEGCDIIFGTSYEYEEEMKKAAQENPKIQFVEATGDNCMNPEVSNYHTFMGAVYEGRYVSGVAAGMKLKELIKTGKIADIDAKVGYVAAFPYAEVISGYTAFLLGVRSVVPQATMTVKYTNSWSNYSLEKRYTHELIDEGCVIISQHSDTTGPAVACEEAASSYTVYHVGYNRSMVDVAPTTSITGCRLNWSPYVVSAVGAIINHQPIESQVDATRTYGRDCVAGFDKGWVEMLDINEVIAADDTVEVVNQTVEELKQGKITVFQGDYTGVNPEDPEDTVNLKDGFKENAHRSSPEFYYVLDDVITIEED